MAANTAIIRSASILAGPVFTATATTAALSPKNSLSASYRPNKVELEIRLYHAQIRAYTRRLRQSVLGHGLPSTASAPQRTIRAAAISLPSNLQAASTDIGLPIISPTSLPAAVPAVPRLGTLPTPPKTPERTDRDRPLLPTCRSCVPLTGLRSLSPTFNDVVFGKGDPILTPNHVFPDNLRRTPGAGRPTRSEPEPECVFHLPAGLLDTPPAAQPSPRLPSPILADVVGLGITVPADNGLWSAISQLVGLGISGVDFGEDGRIEREFPSM